MKVPPITQHSVYIFYPFYFQSTSYFKHLTRRAVIDGLVSRLNKLTLADVSESLSLPSGLQNSIQMSGGGKNVWQTTSVKLSDYLHEHLRRILMAKPYEKDKDEKGENDVFFGHHPLTLTMDCKNLLTGGWGKRGQGLELKLSKSGQRRLRIDEPWIPLQIEGIDLYLFGTGVGVVLLQVCYQDIEKGINQPGHEVIIEGNYAICRTGKQAPQLRWRGIEEPKDKLTLENIITALVPVLKEKPAGKEPRLNVSIIKLLSLFAYTTVQFKDRFSNSHNGDELSYRISRKYTEEYLPSEEQINEGLLKPFENVIHGVGLEGGTILVEEKDRNGNEIPFLKMFSNNSVRSVYLPIALLSYQEYIALLKMNLGVDPPINLYKPTPEAHQILVKYQNALLDFRLNYRFSHASIITMHNMVYDAWRKAFSLDKMLDEVTQDVKEVEAYLDYRLEQQHNLKWETVSHVQTALGIFLGTLIFITGVFGMNFLEFANIHWNDTMAMRIAGIFIGIGAIGAGIYGIFAFKIRHSLHTRKQ